MRVLFFIRVESNIDPNHQPERTERLHTSEEAQAKPLSYRFRKGETDRCFSARDRARRWCDFIFATQLSQRKDAQNRSFETPALQK